MSIFRLSCAPLVMALLLTSCGGRGVVAPAAETKATGNPMPKCGVVESDILYTANITINPVGSEALRNVNLIEGNSPDNDISGQPNETSEPLFKNEPFHIFLPNDIIKKGKGWIKVRLLIFDTTKLDFVTGNGLNGASIKVDKKSLCNNTIAPINNYPSGISDVAIFYISLKGMKDNAGKKALLVPFNILVKTEGSNNTPIIIDPAVRNEG